MAKIPPELAALAEVTYMTTEQLHAMEAAYKSESNYQTSPRPAPTPFDTEHPEILGPHNDHEALPGSVRRSPAGIIAETYTFMGFTLLPGWRAEKDNAHHTWQFTGMLQSGPNAGQYLGYTVTEEYLHDMNQYDVYSFLAHIGAVKPIEQLKLEVDATWDALKVHWEKMKTSDTFSFLAEFNSDDG